MANGYPVRQQVMVIPECTVCGSRMFREASGGLRCEDCGTLLRNPFRA